MLFLLNDKVINLIGGAELLQAAGLPLTMATSYNVNRVIIDMQTAFIKEPNLAQDNPNLAAALCWLITVYSGANSAMFIAPPKARRPADVGYRLANASLTILGTFKALQDQGRLTTRTINDTIWSKMAA